MQCLPPKGRITDLTVGISDNEIPSLSSALRVTMHLHLWGTDPSGGTSTVSISLGSLQLPSLLLTLILTTRICSCCHKC